MKAPRGLDDIRPRTAVTIGVLSAAVFGATVVPEPVAFIQVAAGLSTIGSFALAILNHSTNPSDITEQSVEVHGDGPVTVVQAGESTYGFKFPKDQNKETKSRKQDEDSDERTVEPGRD